MTGISVKVGALLALVGAALTLILAPSAFAQGGEHRAGLVVRYADGKVETRCVTFAEASLSGTQLLERAGLKPVINVAGAFGGAVCSINGQGCKYPAEDCFCKCMGTQCEYWAYYRWADNAWSYSQTGAGSVQVSDGDVQGWSWGPGDFTSGTEPPKVALADICRAGATATSAAATAAANTIPASGLLQYAAYGAIVVLLAVAAVVVLMRRRA
jgi:hypothetical protein